MKYTFCSDCGHCKPERMNDEGKVRCVKLHKFVDLEDESCNEFYNRELTDMERTKLEVISDVTTIQHLRSGKW